MDLFLKLLSYYNNQDNNQTYYRIIDYILHNLDKMEELSINELAEKTFTSPATITRFIHHFGYDKYASFRKEIKERNNPNLKSKFKLRESDINNLKDNPKLFIESYAQEVSNSISDISSTLDIKQIDRFLVRLYETKKIAFFGYDDSINIAKELQTGFLARKKVIEVAENFEKQIEIVNNYDESCLVVIIPSYGNYFDYYNDIYDQLVLKKIPMILITQNYSSMKEFNFEEIIYLLSKRYSRIGNYPLRIFSEYILRRFMYMNLKN